MSIRSVQTALVVLEAVSFHQPVGLRELARFIDVPKSTIQRCLVTLHEAGWLESAPNDHSRWMLTTRAFVVGSTVGDRGGLRNQAMPHMSALASEVQETIHLVLHQGDEVVLVERIDSPHPVRAFMPLGARAHLHTSATGKAVLARLSEREIADYFAGQLEAETEHTITDRNELAAELERIRTCGYSVALEELQSGVTSVGAAICPGNQRPIGAISISAPSDRVPQKLIHRYGATVAEVAPRIASSLPVMPL